MSPLYLWCLFVCLLRKMSTSSELSAGDAKQGVENTQKCTRLNCILAPPFCHLGLVRLRLAFAYYFQKAMERIVSRTGPIVQFQPAPSLQKP